MSQLTHFSRPIIRHLPSLNLVVRFDDSGISVPRVPLPQMEKRYMGSTRVFSRRNRAGSPVL